MKFLKELWQTFISLWNIWFGVLLSFLIGRYVEWDKLRMDRVVSIIALTIASISALTIIKKYCFGKKLNKVESLSLLGQRNINNALDPVSTGEEIGEKVIKTHEISRKVRINIVKKLKAIFKWLGTYWQQWIGLLGTYLVAVYVYYCLAMDKLNWIFKNWIPQDFGWVLSAKIVVAVLVALGVALVTRNQCKWVGVGSNDRAKEYKKHLNDLALGAIPQLNSSTKSVLKDALKEKQKLLKVCEANLASLKKQLAQFETEISAKNILFSTIHVDNAQSIMNELNAKWNETQANITIAENELKTLNEDINNLTNALQ